MKKNHSSFLSFNNCPCPRRTWFCLGSGKQRHRDGVLKEPVLSWFNLRRQSWQPSVPGAGGWQRHFADAFAGGSCLKVHATGDVRRLFVADFGGDDVRHGFVLSYAFKSVFGGDEVALWLRLVRDVGAGERRVCRVECGRAAEAALATEEQQPAGVVHLAPLVGDDLRAVLVHIAGLSEHSLPAEALHSEARTPTGWQVRYYYVNVMMAVGDDVRVHDVGVRATGDAVYLGALYMHRGAPSDSGETALDGRRLFDWRKVSLSRLNRFLCVLSCDRRSLCHVCVCVEEREARSTALTQCAQCDDARRHRVAARISIRIVSACEHDCVLRASVTVS